ncbi:hypothetical protein AALP_AA8G338800 [Arabis alpina]|uniref:Bifunctional inhibitor/plant lipid transfer protein/seed storage helical domain-containing protein n=1 Tax=Arabis alpina TaxID=50452 RepID=A0A087GB78_ARAAL|nr:hypothetical protein AALP_AA8G338800 [Arabis alpina]
MGTNNKGVVMQFGVLAIVLTAAIMVKETSSIRICNIDTNDMQKCRPAITGKNPPPPDKDCCVVVRATNLECICRFKSYLPIFGIDPSKVAALIAKCGVTTVPRTCKA